MSRVVAGSLRELKTGFPRLVQQQGDGVPGGIGSVTRIVRDDHIDFSVAVHVGECESEWVWRRGKKQGTGARGQGTGRIRSFASLRIQQDGDVSALEVSSDDIGTAVAIHVGGTQALIWMAAYRVLHAGRREAAFAVAEDHGDFVVGPALDGYVDVAVAIEIGGGDAVGVRLRRDREWRARGRVEA